jgi:carboxyl-terminal processing protease
MKAVNLLVSTVLSLIFIVGSPFSVAAMSPLTSKPQGDLVAARSHGQREALLAEGILALLRDRHLRKHAVDDATSKTAFDIFLMSLDPSKLYFTQTEVSQLRQYESQLDDQLVSGQLNLAHLAGDLKRQRVKLVASWVAARLQHPFDLNLAEQYETKGKARSFCQTDKALQERWQRELKLEVLAFMQRAKAQATPNTATDASDGPEPAVAKTDDELEAEARDNLAKRYRARFDRLVKQTEEDDVEQFLNAFVQVYDPHTGYLSPYNKQNLDIRMSGSLEGIGALLRTEDGLIKVQRIVPGSASWRQGQLKAEDIILAVAQGNEDPVDVVDARLQDVVQLIRGHKGTIVKLSVRKPDGNLVVVPIKRDVVRLEDTYAKAAVLQAEPNAAPVAYIHLPKFYGNVRGEDGEDVKRQASEDIQPALTKLQSARVRGLILDVRGNSGGLLQEAVRLSGLFIKTGPIVATRDAEGKQKVLSDKDPRVEFNGPMVVLIDRFSASASEILAAALQDYGRAVIVGSPTHGKGTVQYLYSLDRAVNAAARLQPDETPLGTLKLTRYQFYRINGDSTQLHGVTPDIELPDPAAHLEAGESSKEHAIPWNTIEPVKHVLWTPSWKTDRLQTLSKARQANNAAFAKVKAQSELLNERQKNTVEELKKDIWFKKRKEELDALEALKLDDEKRFIVKPEPYATNENVPADTLAAMDDEWIKTVQDDPWLEEALHIIADMTQVGPESNLVHDQKQ